ncbi:MAG: hypothetical protein HY815_16300, partial [Candidatus Riflebacteria bacterium]|nr:hypothetical protein [Candidatus Riflebacteria bacterium]
MAGELQETLIEYGPPGEGILGAQLVLSTKLRDQGGLLLEVAADPVTR